MSEENGKVSKVRLNCQRSHYCPIFGPGCERMAEKDCELLSFVKKELSRFSEKIKAMLEEKQVFSYEEGWYQKLRSEILKGKLITEKELREIEDRAVNEYIKKGGE